ncbi:MAG: Exodeoxyribonuclease large subunit [Armatimonadetes bacterium]|jgi:exodeoxyribonuclease VII large subunit|nr:Exodeoxyribonuclease large subunit [Armatimonadota bacterium]
MDSVYSPFDFDDHAVSGGGSAAALSITLLTRHLSAVLRCDDILQDVWVRGEISNFTRAGSGHLYFSLKDEGASAGCVMWRSAAARLGFSPTSGMEVIAHGQIDVYPQRGQYQLVIDALIPDGAGARQLALEQSRARLLRDGLLDPERKRPIPVFPERVAVVTSLHGAAVQDICVILRSRAHPPDIVLVPAQVQGDLAEASLLTALALANERSGADLIIVGRGGGSVEDLWCFNSERVARAIAASRLPVIAAIGHETDFTLADLAADHRAPTPTAAAELIAAQRDEQIARLIDGERRARAALATRVEYSRLRWDGVRRRAPLARPVELIERQRQRLDDLQARLDRAREVSLQRWQHRLALAAGKLQGLSPLSTLARGYTLATRLPEDTPLTSVGQVKAGDEVRMRLVDGSIDVRVESVRTGEQEEATDE